MIRNTFAIGIAVSLGLGLAGAPAAAQDSVYIGVGMFGEHVPQRGGVEEASGDFNAEFDIAGGRVCYYLELTGVEGADGAGIHRGGDSDTGEQVLALTLPPDPDEEVCVVADAALLQRMAADREGYYVMVRDPGHPDGAIRGQLSD